MRVVRHILIVASRHGPESPWEKHFFRSSAWGSRCTCSSWTVPGIPDYVVQFHLPFFASQRVRRVQAGVVMSTCQIEARWSQQLPGVYAEEGWHMCWNSQIKTNKKNLSSHWCGVLASQELDFLEPVSSCYSTQRSHDWELQVPREDIWRSLGNNFGIQGGPLVFNLSLPLQVTLHDIPSCTLCSRQSELLPSMPWWPPCLCSNSCLSLKYLPEKLNYLHIY